MVQVFNEFLMHGTMLPQKAITKGSVTLLEEL
jgi:hypothetical protein